MKHTKMHAYKVVYKYDVDTCQGKFSVWGRVLEWHHRCQEAFFIMENLLCRGCSLQCFGPSPQEISQRFQSLSTVGQKVAGKVYHAKKTLQLFDILRGWAFFLFSRCDRPWEKVHTCLHVLPPALQDQTQGGILKD
jgi:hypothetical protein